MTDRELMQQALEAMEFFWDNGYRNIAMKQKATMDALREKLAQPEQELVCVCGAIWEGQELVSTPLPRQWQRLTEEEISSLWDGHIVPVFGKNGINPIVFARAIEAKLCERNA